MIIYQVLPVDHIEPELLRDINTQDKPFAVVRDGVLGRKVWSFHSSRKLAEAAMRRWRSRDIVTR